MKQWQLLRRLWIWVVAVLLCLAAGGCANATTAPATGAVVGGGGPTATVTTYVAVGASDSYGVGTDDPATQSWPADVAATLGQQVHLVNLGIPGETVADALGNEVPIAVTAKPNVITVWLAVNDVLDTVPLPTYQSQLQTLLRELHQQTTAQIYVGNLPDLTLLPYFATTNAGTLSDEVQQWNIAIAADCAAVGVHLVDLWNGWAELRNHPEYISSDGLHPSTEGAERIAAIFAAAISQGAA